MNMHGFNAIDTQKWLTMFWARKMLERILFFIWLHCLHDAETSLLFISHRIAINCFNVHFGLNALLLRLFAWANIDSVRAVPSQRN